MTAHGNPLRLLIPLIAILVAAPFALGQADDPAPAAPASADVTPFPTDPEAALARFVGLEEPWTYPLDELEASLRPLEADAITPIADQWLAYLQEIVAESAALRLAGDSAQPALTEQNTHRAAVIARLEAVTEELETKGGDPARYDTFIGAIPGVELDPADAGQLTEFALTWLQSPEGGIAVGMNILKFIAVLIAFWIVSSILAAGTRQAVKRLATGSDLLQNFFVQTVKRITRFIGIVVAISMLGVNIGPLVAAIGAAGLVIGLALQGTLSNFASGILILLYRPYDVDDVITAGGITGKVAAMNLVSTKLLTFDNQNLFVPNNSIWNGVITNITGNTTRRVDLTFGIGYADDQDRAGRIIEEVIAAHPKVLAEPAPVVKLHELADSSVNFIARPWCLGSDYWDVYWDVTRTIKERFDNEGVNIPFPQQDLHLPGPVEVVVKNG